MPGGCTDAKFSWQRTQVLLVSPDTIRLRRAFHVSTPLNALFSLLVLGSIFVAGCETPSHTADGAVVGGWAGRASAR